MFLIEIEVSMKKKAAPVDCARVAQWIGESLSNTDFLDPDMEAVIHAVHVIEQDA